MALEDQCSERVARLLDRAELMPILLADPNKTEAELLELLRAIADEFPFVSKYALDNYGRGWSTGP
jgi:hypothetical protein